MRSFRWIKGESTPSSRDDGELAPLYGMPPGTPGQSLGFRSIVQPKRRLLRTRSRHSPGQLKTPTEQVSAPEYDQGGAPEADTKNNLPAKNGRRYEARLASSVGRTRLS